MPPAFRRCRLPSLVAASLLALGLLVPALHGDPSSVRAAPMPLPVPPTGGLTQGLSGTGDPLALIDAQEFEVQSVWVLDAARQRWLAYVPGAPDHVNTLTSNDLREDSIVTIRRAGTLPPSGALVLERDATADPSGEPHALAFPPAGGLVLGVSGTNDPATFVEAQPFTVQTLWMLDVASQQWLVYVPGAPPHVSTLDRATLREDSVVTVRRQPLANPTGVEYHRAAEERLVHLTNEARIAAGLEPLEVDTRLQAVARLHSADMLIRDFFAHENPDGLDPFGRIRAADITYRWAGENLARAATADRAHELLMESPGHRENILNEHFRRVGIGAVESPRGILFTQIFTD